MQRHPIPRLKEKKACPIALKNTFPSTLLKSGLSRNSIPAPAPGRVTEQNYQYKDNDKQGRHHDLRRLFNPLFYSFHDDEMSNQ